MKKILFLLAIVLGVTMTACRPSVGQILEKPSSEISPDDVTRLIATIEEINIPAQEYIKAGAWAKLVNLVEENQEKFDLAAKCYTKLNTLDPEQIADTAAHEVMGQFANVISALAAHQMLSASAFMIWFG